MNLKELREKNKLTQAAFAAPLGVSGKSIYLIESGRMKLSKKIEPAERKARTRAAKAEKKIDKAATDAAQAVLDTEKKIDKRKRKARAKVKADKPAVEAVAEAVAAPVEAVKEKKTRKRTRKTEMTFVIQSPFGGEITPEEIRARIGEADAVYIRVDQNKAYWVKGDENGDIDLW